MVQAPVLAAPGLQVFISYSVTDIERARELAQALREVGLHPWFEADEVAPGDNWALMTGRALEESSALVAIISLEGGRSRQVNLDLSFSLLGKRYAGRVVPMLLDGASLDGVPWALDEFVVPTTSSAWRDACRTVALSLRKQLVATAPSR